MLFIIITVFLAIATAFATHTLLQPSASSRIVGSRTQLYQSQLAEIDREEKNGLITEDDARALRTEAQRRLLDAADEAKETERDMPLARTTTVLLMTGMIVIGGAGLYAVMGKPDIPSAHTSAADARVPALLGPQQGPSAPAASGVDRMITQLAQRLQTEPDDAEGWRMLGWSYYSRGQYVEATQAYKRAVDLEPENANFLAAYGESLIGTNSGRVSQEALQIFDKVLTINPDEPRSRFFKGMALDQAGDTASALKVWIEMLNTAAPGAAWTEDVRAQVLARAESAGIDIEGRIKNRSASSTAPNPSKEDIAAAMQMSPQDRQAMIEGMVASLAARLEANPDDPDGWVRLIRSQMTLGQMDRAEKSLRTAANSFQSRPTVRAKIIADAKLLGVELK